MYQIFNFFFFIISKNETKKNKNRADCKNIKIYEELILMISLECIFRQLMLVFFILQVGLFFDANPFEKYILNKEKKINPKKYSL